MPVRYSLSEIDTTCRKAARGAGYSWGLAEEAGKIARILTAFDFCGAEIVLGVLQRADQSPKLQVPQQRGKVWTSKTSLSCPITAATIVGDRAQHLAAGTIFDFTALIYPVTLIPTLFRISQAREISLSLSWGENRIRIDASGIYRNSFSKMTDQPYDTCCQLAPLSNPTSALIRPQPHSYPVDTQCWKELNAFAHRTYVPATEESRLSGAGAGLHDND